MVELSIDIGCITFVREANMASSTWENGLVFFDGNEFGDGQCWSALGLAPGFKGSATNSVQEFNAPAGWQLISLSAGCGGSTRNTVQHEVGHALGRFHEFNRPDRDDHIIVSATGISSGGGKNAAFASYGYPLEIASTMMYCSDCLSFSGSPDLTAKDGTTWGNLKGLSTLDALKTEAHYCKMSPAEGFKNKVTCTKPDLAGFFLPVFTDRLCDNVEDCADGADEDGSMFECKISDLTHRNKCCTEFSFDLSGTEIACSYTQDNNGKSNLDHEGWTCTGLSVTTYLKFVTWFEGGKWLLDNGHFDDTQSVSFWTMASDTGTGCPPTSGWSSGAVGRCKNFGTVESNIPNTYTRPITNTTPTTTQNTTTAQRTTTKITTTQSTTTTQPTTTQITTNTSATTTAVTTTQSTTPESTSTKQSTTSKSTQHSQKK